MANISFKLTRNDVSPTLSKLAHTARHPAKVLRAMGTVFMSITMGTFNSVGEKYRPTAWAPLKHDQRGGPAKAGDPSKLQKSGTLARAFHLEVDDHHASVSNPTIYAATHQLGRDSGRGAPIPARPFFPVLDGKLTPAAEEKIRLAGEAVIKREAA